jgi:hypothetical protein
MRNRKNTCCAISIAKTDVLKYTFMAYAPCNYGNLITMAFEEEVTFNTGIEKEISGGGKKGVQMFNG